MRRTFGLGTKARLSYSGGPHAPLNMADGTAGSSTVSESKEAMEVLKNFKDLRKRGLGNIAQYTVEQMFLVCHLLRFFTFILFFYTIRHV